MEETDDVTTRPKPKLIAQSKLAEESFEDVICSEGYLVEASHSDIISWLPIVYLTAVPVENTWTSTSVGYMKSDKNLYDCPVYLTSNRGQDYVFLASLRTLEPARKWVIAGVALLMQTEE